MRKIDSINFTLTTHCNMSCPNCCAGITLMSKQSRVFCDWSYLENAAKYFYGIRRINLTGGEPTIHPRFEEFVPKLKKLFGCQILSVWTNGTMLTKKLDSFKYFDEIHITNYTESTFQGSPNNTKAIATFRELMQGSSVNIFDTSSIVHALPEDRGTKSCFRGKSDTVEFVNGRVFPCSSSSGLPTNVSVELSETWISDVLKLTPPCHECVFAEK